MKNARLTDGHFGFKPDGSYLLDSASEFTQFCKIAVEVLCLFYLSRLRTGRIGTLINRLLGRIRTLLSRSAVPLPLWALPFPQYK